AVTAVALSADGKQLAAGCFNHRTVLFDAETGRPRGELEPEGAVSVAFSGDGRLLAAVRGGQAAVWDVGTGRKRRELQTENQLSRFRAVTFSPDGKHVLTAGTPTADNEAALWEVDGGRLVQRFVGHGSAVGSAVFGPDGRRVLTAADNRAQLWDTASGK